MPLTLCPGLFSCDFIAVTKALKVFEKSDKIFFGKNVLPGVPGSSIYYESDR